MIVRCPIPDAFFGSTVAPLELGLALVVEVMMTEPMQRNDALVGAPCSATFDYVAVLDLQVQASHLASLIFYPFDPLGRMKLHTEPVIAAFLFAELARLQVDPIPVQLSCEPFAL